jgi:SAM-dependent methyltransferase
LHIPCVYRYSYFLQKYLTPDPSPEGEGRNMKIIYTVSPLLLLAGEGGIGGMRSKVTPVIGVMRFEEKKFAKEYEKRLLAEGYPGILLEKIKNEVSESGSILDVGAGTGFFSIPLAGPGHPVTAVEPSASMIELFKKKIPENLKNSIVIDNTTWEEWDGDKKESLICVHSLYTMADPESAVKKMIRSARKILIIIRSDSGRVTLTQEIRSRLKPGAPSVKYNEIVKEVLDKENLSHSLLEINQTKTISFTDLDSEAEYYRFHINLEKSSLENIKNIIRRLTQKKGNAYFFTVRQKDNLYVINEPGP